MNWTLEDIDKIKQAINEKARVDKEFRLVCLENPRQAVEQISGKIIPAGFNIRFIENAGAHLTHVLPDYISPFGEELSEDELVHVSAGLVTLKDLRCINCFSQVALNSQGGYDCADCGHHSDNISR